MEEKDASKIINRRQKKLANRRSSRKRQMV